MPDLLDLLYRAVLRRPCTDEERRDGAARLRAAGNDPVGLLQDLVRSPEFASAQLLPGYDWRRDPGIAPFLTRSVVETTTRLRQHPIDETAFDAHWHQRFRHELGPEAANEPHRRYGEDHRRRYLETVRVLAALCGATGAGARLCDFGLSVLSAMHRKLLPGLELVTVDRPVDAAHLQFFERISREAGASSHHSADLTDPGFLTPALAAAMGRFDVILLTEVLEHLTAHPVQVLQPMRQLLRPGGHLFVTTPNFFSAHHLAEVQARIHPQQVFPRDGNVGVHHHHREGSMRELLQFVGEAGLEVAAFWFSECWDDAALCARLRGHEDQHSNLAVLARRPPDDASPVRP